MKDYRLERNWDGFYGDLDKKILEYFLENPGANIKDIHKAMGVSRVTLWKRMKRLVKKNQLRWQFDGNNKRFWVVDV